MSANTTTALSSLNEYFQDVYVSAPDLSTPFWNLMRQLGREVPFMGGDSRRWNLVYGDNASTAEITEGGTVASGNASYADAVLPYGLPIQTKLSLTGTLQDFNSGSGKRFDALLQELESAWRSHRGAVEDRLIADAEAAIDGDGSYAGLLRSTFGLESYEAASAAAALALSDLRNADEALATDPVVGDISGNIIVSQYTRRREYAEVATGTGAGDPRVTQATDPVIDAGLMRAATQFDGKPWYDISRMTTGTILQFNPMDVEVIPVRAPVIEKYAKSTDTDEWAITSHYRFVHKNPRRGAKITAFV